MRKGLRHSSYKFPHAGRAVYLYIKSSANKSKAVHPINTNTQAMKKVIQFGENVEGYNIPVLNEREIRAAAGLLFLVIFISLILILDSNNFVPAKYAVTLFLSDFIVRVYINPRYSPTLIIGRLIVRRQTPEYVGAKQKKFGWKVGIALSGIMFIFLVVINSYSLITGFVCLFCLIFLFFESAFGICLACNFYALFFKEKAQYCPGEVCELKDRQEIQKTTGAQIWVILGFVAYAALLISVFNGYYSRAPHDLFGIFGKQKVQQSAKR